MLEHEEFEDVVLLGHSYAGVMSRKRSRGMPDSPERRLLTDRGLRKMNATFAAGSTRCGLEVSTPFADGHIVLRAAKPTAWADAHAHWKL